MLRVAVVGALAGILTPSLAPIALADTLCDNRYSTYCCNQTVGLRLVMTYKSQWYSEKTTTRTGCGPTASRPTTTFNPSALRV